MAAKTSQTSTLATAKAETTITAGQTEALLLSKRVSKLATFEKKRLERLSKYLKARKVIFAQICLVGPYQRGTRSNDD